MPSRDEIRQATRTRVVETADLLFQQRGFAATTIRDIAEAAGVSIGTVMAAGDKNDLLVQVFDSLVEREHARQTPGPVSGEKATRVDRIMTILQPFIALFAERSELARTYASILVSGLHSSTLFADLAVRLIAEIATVIDDSGGPAARNADASSRAVYLAYVGALFTWSARPTATESDLVDTIRSAVSVIDGCADPR